MSFDGVARSYAFLEKIAFGSELQRARTAFLGQIGSASRVLIVGEGNGRFLVEFLRHAAGSSVDCVDASKTMLDLARRRLEKIRPEYLSRVHFIHSPIENWSLGDQQYDLIVTDFVLDCFSSCQLKSIIAKLAQAAAPAASWLVADFHYPSTSLKRLRARFWIGTMYLFFRTFAGVKARRLTDPSPFLRASGFSCVQEKKFQHGLVKSEVWQHSLSLSSAPLYLRARLRAKGVTAHAIEARADPTAL